MIIQILLFIYLLTHTSQKSQTDSYQSFLQSTPISFGLLMLADAKRIDKQVLAKQINKYASMDCQVITSMSVVWAIPDSGEHYSLQKSKNWVRMVGFVNSNSRVKIPKQIHEKVYFSIDYDTQIDCNEMKEGFQRWKSKAVGEIGPIMSFKIGVFDIEGKKSRVVFKDKGQVYSMGLLDTAFISSFFIQLYNNNDIWQIQRIRNETRRQIICEDITINFLVNYFFPELIPVKLNYQNKDFNQKKIRQNENVQRTSCLTKIIQILGYSPLRLVHKISQQKRQNFISSVTNYSIFMKRTELSMLMNISSGRQEVEKKKEDDLVVGDVLRRQKKSAERGKKQNKQEIQAIKMRLESTRSQKKRLEEGINKIKLYIPANRERDEEKNHKQQMKKITTVINMITDEGIAILIVITLMVIFTLIKFLDDEPIQQLKKQFKETKTKQQEEDTIFEDEIQIKTDNIN